MKPFRRAQRKGVRTNRVQYTPMESITLIATAKFGLEALVRREVEALGFRDLRVSDGRVEFEATAADIARLNIWLRCADRLLLKMGEFMNALLLRST